MQKEKECIICGQIFTPNTKYVRTCSSKCSHILSAKVMLERGNQFKRQYYVNDNFLKEESNDKYYYLGIMSADGNINRNSIQLGQSGKEGLKLIKYIKQILGTNSVIYSSKPKVGKTAYILAYRSEEILSDLISYNIVANKTKTFTIPNPILSNEDKLRYFLIGYIDGDGSIGIYKVSSSENSKTLCINFVCSNNMYNQLKDNKYFSKAKTTKISDTLNEFRFNGLNAVEFGEWLYQDCTVFKSYKYHKYKYYINNIKTMLSKIGYNKYISKQAQKYLTSLGLDNHITSAELAEKYNITLTLAESIKYQWRLKNGLSRKLNKTNKKAKV